ncbi:MAG: 50S ribosomal protein L9 [Peptostreptococcales bacterium]|jgi:large subunit ribosomal protein L9
MKVILLKDIKKIGKAGDVIDASDGYARNYLIPRGLAKEGTSGNLKERDKKKAAEDKKKEGEREEAIKLAEKIENISVKIITKGGEGGRLFGSVTSKDIADQLEEQYQISIDKKKMQLEGPIKEVGLFHIPIKLYPEIAAKLKVEVVATS